jgi:hypothetical protein
MAENIFWLTVVLWSLMQYITGKLAGKQTQNRQRRQTEMDMSDPHVHQTEKTKRNIVTQSRYLEPSKRRYSGVQIT